MEKTVFFENHRRLEARFVDFAGYAMPLQYEGIKSEHLWCRKSCAIFDTSHMAIFTVRGEKAAEELGGILTANVKNIRKGRCRYSFMLNEKGGVVDDLIIYPLKPGEYMIVANASTKEKDMSWISARLKSSAITDEGRNLVKIDVQGPSSEDVLESVFHIKLKPLVFYSFGFFMIAGEETLVSYSGYTGEKGYELYIDKKVAQDVWEKILSDKRVKPAGLGARDTLRLEMGMPLYGQDLDENTTPLEAGLGKFVDFSHSFTGKNALETSALSKKMAFLLSLSRKSPRHGYELFHEGAPSGYVSSGSFSPSLQRGVGMAYINPGIETEGQKISAGSGNLSCECSLITKKELVTLVNTAKKL